jgi:low affinity Fe/Cu permease
MSETDTAADTRFSLTRWFTDFANVTSRLAGRPISFVVCILLIVIWAVTGPVFSYSDTWQLIINTSTTIVTFLMVFLIQNTQNRDNAALQAKLDELIRVTNAKNHFIGIERLTDKELEQILDEMEEHSEPMPLEQKAKAVARKANAVASGKPRASSSPTGPNTTKGAAPPRNAKSGSTIARKKPVR